LREGTTELNTEYFLCVIAVLLTPYSFYPRDAMLARVTAIATCPSVYLSVCHTPVLCQNKESWYPMILVFWRKISSQHSKGFPERGLKQGWGGKISATRTWPRPFWRKILGVMFVLLSLKTCIPNLKSVAPNRFGAIGILPPKLGVTWPWPRPFLTKNLGGHVCLVHEKMSVKFEVCSCNHFEAIGI